MGWFSKSLLLAEFYVRLYTPLATVVSTNWSSWQGTQSRTFPVNFDEFEKFPSLNCAFIDIVLHYVDNPEAQQTLYAFY
jgi:hypothetical protein